MRFILLFLFSLCMSAQSIVYRGDSGNLMTITPIGDKGDMRVSTNGMVIKFKQTAVDPEGRGKMYESEDGTFSMGIFWKPKTFVGVSLMKDPSQIEFYYPVGASGPSFGFDSGTSPIDTDCPACFGKGYCRACNGKGYLVNPYNGSNAGPCTACGGSKKCFRCDGSRKR